MRMIHVAIATGSALLAGAAGAAVTDAGSGPVEAPASKQASAPLRPLSDHDQQSTHESGCQLSFDTGRSTLVYVIGHDFMVRTRAGLQTCRISERQFGALSGNGGTQSCGGLRIAIRQTGRVIGHQESDSASGRAVLTVTGRGRPWSVRGHWGSAC
jgi:hypothetical protein